MDEVTPSAVEGDEAESAAMQAAMTLAGTIASKGHASSLTPSRQPSCARVVRSCVEYECERVFVRACVGEAAGRSRDCQLPAPADLAWSE